MGSPHEETAVGDKAANNSKEQITRQQQQATGSLCRASTGVCQPVVEVLHERVKQRLPHIQTVILGNEVPRRHQCENRSQGCTDVNVGIANHASNPYPTATPSEGKVSTTLRAEVEEFLPFVRFLAMSTDEFVEHVLPTRILTSDEAVALLMNIKDIPNVPLPTIASCGCTEKRNKVRSSSVLFCQHHCTRHDQEVLSDFRTSKTICLTQVCVPAVMIDRETIVQVTSPTRVVGQGTWQGIACKFNKPIKLIAGTSYCMVVQLAYGPCSGCHCNIVSEHDGILFSGKTLASCPVFLDYWEAT